MKDSQRRIRFPATNRGQCRVVHSPGPLLIIGSFTLEG